MTVLCSLVNSTEDCGYKNGNQQKMRFLQVGFPIQFTSIFQAYVLEMGRKRYFVKMLVLSHITVTCSWFPR